MSYVILFLEIFYPCWMLAFWAAFACAFSLKWNCSTHLTVLIFFQVVGDRTGAVFGGLVEAPLRPINKRKYQVVLKYILKFNSFVKCFLLHMLTFNIEQGTNDTFVFTNTSGHPVIFRPTGISSSPSLLSRQQLRVLICYWNHILISSCVKIY